MSSDPLSLPTGAAALRRRRRFTRARIGRALAPYGLIAPSIAVIVAILAYPLFELVKLSFQRYGLFELIRHQGTWVGLDNFTAVLHDQVFWQTLARTVVFTAVNVGLTMVLGTLIAL